MRRPRVGAVRKRFLQSQVLGPTQIRIRREETGDKRVGSRGELGNRICRSKYKLIDLRLRIFVSNNGSKTRGFKGRIVLSQVNKVSVKLSSRLKKEAEGRVVRSYPDLG
ncbi:hypothetical protein E2562_006039 [Oryza meyeriana var. granulata]|uniref:Uncharacterized protein n=1 Tax=Oryza meyeriana var. granulata TaxID=110450 RepID=A0A6G1EVB7_9ORYZ|nr:hypothetical protein E2562_006039 [Oryza meyeriana var. granulata]